MFLLYYGQLLLLPYVCLSVSGFARDFDYNFKICAIIYVANANQKRSKFNSFV